jgi:X-X-X-Leu-X-X-Gly heptad repeat protein
LSEAERFLRQAGRDLRAQADEQRRASNAGSEHRGGSSDGAGPTDLKAQLKEIREILEKLGIPIDKINELMGRLGLLNELDLLSGPLKALAENEALQTALSAAGSALEWAGMIVDFVSVVADNPHLPLDEAVVLASATLAVGIATSAGVKAAGKAIGGAVAGMFSGGVATVVGVVVGEVVGTALNAAFDAADEEFHITENVAQQALETYRFAKARDFEADRIFVDGTKVAVGELAEGAKNLAEGAGNLAEGAWDGAKGGAEKLFGILPGVD